MTLLAGGAALGLVDALIPRRALEADEQYRFHFDMTKCVGCRSCGIACNEQNGNPAEIKWRRVGDLEGGTYPDTQRTYLSMGCNHCLDADCVNACPESAIEIEIVSKIAWRANFGCAADSWVARLHLAGSERFVLPMAHSAIVFGKLETLAGGYIYLRSGATFMDHAADACELFAFSSVDWIRSARRVERGGRDGCGTFSEARALAFRIRTSQRR